MRSKKPLPPRRGGNKLSRERPELLPQHFESAARKSELTMDREPQFATDFEALRTLCDETIPREERHRLMQSLAHHKFVDAEHAVVFESIVALFPRGPISAAQLRVHLNNRGFCDTDVDPYFRSGMVREINKKHLGEGTP